MRQDTIAAIATAMSNSGIGIIRISGDNSLQIIDRIYQGKKKKKLCEERSHTIHYGYIVDKDAIIDEVLVMLMKGPNSFTGEDVVEIDCHGGVYVIKRILETVIKYGARPAEPGEFTKRAFLNGKMDLSQAEAVMDLIESKNEYALKSSVSQLKGKVHEKIQGVREQILYHTAFIETALDDPEHYDLDGYGEKLKRTLEALEEELNTLILTSDNGRLIKEGIRTVIVGKPNAGKSSLLNLLVGEERAIVTSIEGTTRDILEEQINLNGISLNVIDTAGIRDTEDLVEQIGVEKAKTHAEDADLIIYVLDVSRPLDENDYEIMKMIKDKQTIVLLNKSDLTSVVTVEELKAIADKPIIQVSMKSEQGMKELEDTLVQMFFEGKLAMNEEVVITNVRHKAALNDAYYSLLRVGESIENKMPEDFYSIDLIDAYESLGSITGESIGEDLVNEIFSKFCMGK